MLSRRQTRGIEEGIDEYGRVKSVSIHQYVATHSLQPPFKSPLTTDSYFSGDEPWVTLQGKIIYYLFLIFW